MPLSYFFWLILSFYVLHGAVDKLYKLKKKQLKKGCCLLDIFTIPTLIILRSLCYNYWEKPGPLENFDHFQILKMHVVNMSNEQPHQDEKCQLKATHGSSMNDEETLTPQVRLQVAPLLYTGTAKELTQYTPVTRKLTKSEFHAKHTLGVGLIERSYRTFKRKFLTCI